MLLVIDIGNTNIVYGVYNRDKLLGSWRMTTNKKGTADEQGLFLYDVLALNDIDRKKIDGIYHFLSCAQYDAVLKSDVQALFSFRAYDCRSVHQVGH